MATTTILIDLSVLENRPFTGVEGHALQLCRHLPEHRPAHRLVAALGRAELGAADLPGFELLRGRFLPRSLWRRLSLPRLARRCGADILFSPVSHAPTGRGFVSVRTVHDLGPGARAPRPRDLATITPSGATLRRLEQLVPEAQAPRIVIPHGVDDAFFSLARDPADPPRALVIGRVRDRRRPDLVAAAAALVAERVPGFELRWIGPGGEGRPAAPGLRFLGWLPRAELLAELSRARLLLAPSEVEGFGLPIVEAMAAGLPVLAREQPALPEVGGDMVSVYDSDDPEELAAKIRSMLEGDLPAPAEPDLRAWARRFDWDLCARRHADFFDSLL